MKTRGKYLVNPVPYALIVANPGKKRKKKRVVRRNPSKKGRKAAGIYVIRKATKNPIRKKTRRVKKRASAKFSQPAKIMKTKRRRSRRKASLTRNPARRSRRRSSSRRVRNPIGSVVRDTFNSNMLTLAGGVVIGNIGTTMVINRLVAPPAGSTRPFDLPFVDYTVPAANFYTKNAWALAIYKLAIGIGASYLLRNQSPRLSQGLAIGSVAGAISDVLKKSGVITPGGTINGVGRNFGAGNGVGYLPGTSTRFTGPAQQFLNNNVPRPRVGAAVRSGFTERTAQRSESAFGAAN